MFVGCSEKVVVDNQINKTDNKQEQNPHIIDLNNQKKIDDKKQETSNEDLKKEVRDEVNSMIEKKEDVKFQCNNECSQDQTACGVNERYECDMNSNGCYKWKLKEVCSNGCTSGQCVEEEPTNVNYMDEIEQAIENKLN